VYGILTYEVGGIIVRQEGEADGGEKPADVGGRAVISDLAPAEQQQLVEAVEHARTRLVHRHHDALTLLLRVFLQPGYEGLGRVRVQAAGRLLAQGDQGFFLFIVAYSCAPRIAEAQPPKLVASHSLVAATLYLRLCTYDFINVAAI
jgi:hypothetical protein